MKYYNLSIYIYIYLYLEFMYFSLTWFHVYCLRAKKGLSPLLLCGFKYRREKPAKLNIKPQIYGVWQINWLLNMAILVFRENFPVPYIYTYKSIYIYICTHIHTYIYIYINPQYHPMMELDIRHGEECLRFGVLSQRRARWEPKKDGSDGSDRHGLGVGVRTFSIYNVYM